jgi:L-alanine-DL-glutamate epimerase-like enolase superfamily enzyme
MEPMKNLHSRRHFLQQSLALPAVPSFSALSPALTGSTARSTDIRIEQVEFSYEEFLYRAPYKFGGVPVDRATILNVSIRIRSRRGATAVGFGSMPLGNVWAFPSRDLPYQSTLGAMQALATRIAAVTRDFTEFGHPIDLNHHLHPIYLAAARETSNALKLSPPIPKLATLVTASPFDAAIHDAYGKLHQLNCYQTYGSKFLNQDLGSYLGRDFRGESLPRYLRAEPVGQLALFHSVGGSDAVLPSEVKSPVGDGMPESLGEWIQRDGLTHLKIKLQGENLAWDIERVVTVDRIAGETRPEVDWRYCVDFNERCPNVGYVLEFLRKVKERTPRSFERIQYVEQPTARDLESNRGNVMHEAAKLRPVVIDESLVDLDSLRLAREMGYTGVALKACKGQSQAMLMAAAARKYGMFLTVQDLTCPGASLIHSVGIAAHVPGVAGVEGNSRQYMPAANRPWEKRFPGIFVIRNGMFRTGELRGLGLSAVVGEATKRL